MEKILAFWKKYYFSDRNARKYSKSKIDFNPYVHNQLYSY